MYYFSHAALKDFLFIFGFSFAHGVPVCDFLVFILFRVSELLDSVNLYLSSNLGTFAIIFSNIFLPHSLSPLLTEFQLYTH